MHEAASANYFYDEDWLLGGIIDCKCGAYWVTELILPWNINFFLHGSIRLNGRDNDLWGDSWINQGSAWKASVGIC